jgi:hypothetical protein
MMCRSAFVPFTRRVSDPVLDVMPGFAAGVAAAAGRPPPWPCSTQIESR